MFKNWYLVCVSQHSELQLRAAADTTQVMVRTLEYLLCMEKKSFMNIFISKLTC